MSEQAHPRQGTRPENRVSTDQQSAPGRTEYWESREVARNRCPDCEVHVPVSEGLETTCPECDVVIDDTPVSRRPARVFDAADRRRKRRSGGRVTILYADRGIGVGKPRYATTDGRGKRLSRDQRRLFTDGGWKNGRTSDHARLQYALSEIRRIGGNLGVPRAEQAEAARLYREARDESCIVGRNVDAFTAACLLVAVRNSSTPIPVSVAELEPVSRASADTIRMGRKALERELEVGVRPVEPREFLPVVASTFDLPTEVERTVRGLLEAVASDVETRCRGFSPRTLVGAAVHFACDLTEHDGPTLAELGGELDVSGSTISERKSLFEPHADSVDRE